MSTKSNLSELVKRNESRILEDWIKEQFAAITKRADLMSEADLRDQSAQFLKAFNSALTVGVPVDIDGPAWADVRGMLDGISLSRLQQGFTPTETATFVLSLKQPLFTLVHNEYASDAKALVDELWSVTVLLDKLGLFTTETFIRSREKVIMRQQAEMLELSTPVVKIWDQIVALPLIGTLDSSRTQVMMETLLEEIMRTSSRVAIIDITGVSTVDTLVAQHLMKTVSAARLMGAECVISGIRPQIAQTMVHLGVSFSDIVTVVTVADAIRFAFDAVGLRVTHREKAA